LALAASFWASGCILIGVMENTLVRDDANRERPADTSEVALNKIRAFVRSLGDVDRRAAGSKDYGQSGAEHVSYDSAGT